MTKEELIHITLKQLSESLKNSPENFRLEDASVGPTTASFPGPTIVWQHKVKVEDNKYILDPLNSTKTIIVCLNNLSRQLQIFIYNREVNNINNAMMADAQATISYGMYVPMICYRTYRQFSTLREELVQNKIQKEFVDYMQKLNKIFPATHEDDIFN